MIKNVAIFLAVMCCLACQKTKKNQIEKEKTDGPTSKISNLTHHIPSITKVFDAHGGYDNWARLKQLSYENGGNKTLVELQNRYTRIESSRQTVGFDGQNVWVNPPGEDADKQRMRYNLVFYFYAFPFVVGDPGVIYEDLEPMNVKGKNYNVVKISYEPGVGDSPGDNYVILSDTQTNKMEWLLYTATFGGRSSNQYRLIKYEGWKEISGVILPGLLQWYEYKDGLVGDPRGNAWVFENIEVSTEYPEKIHFEMPRGAQIAALPSEK